jgi:hypothetical protein
LPVPSDRPLHHVDGARLELEQYRLVTRRLQIKRAKAHPARTGEGQSDYDAVYRLVAMPSDRRSRTVLADKRLHQA